MWPQTTDVCCYGDGRYIMALTPNIMMAAEGLLANTALAITPVNSALYLDQVIVSDYAATIENYAENTVTSVFGSNSGKISSAVLDAFIHALDDLAPYISNVVPESIGITTTFYTTFFDQSVANLFPSNQQFALYALIAIGQVSTANQYVNSAISGQALAAQTFISSDALISGNIASVSTSVRSWGQELINSGLLFNFANLSNLGTPQSIIEALIRSNMLTSINDELATQGLNPVTLQKVIKDDPDITLKPLTQKRCYDAFLLVVGEKLTDVLKVMGFVTPGITNLAELMDLRKVFRTTYPALTTPNNGVLENIFNALQISAYVNSLTPAATAYMPPAQAKANAAFACSLQQIKGILDSTPEKIGTAAINLENNDGLGNTGALTTALPASTSAALIESMGGGSGPDGTFYLSDLIGAPAGEPQNSSYSRMSVLFEQIQADGGFDGIAEVLGVMRGVLDDVYTVSGLGTAYHIEIPNPFIIDPIPGNGTYNNKDAALDELIAELKLATLAYIAAYPAQSSELLSLFSTSYTSQIEGVKQLWDADLKFQVTYVDGFETGPGGQDGFPPNKKTTLSFAENLPGFAKKTSKGDIAVILESMATDTLGGNAIIAAMRESRNTNVLSDAGVTGDNQLSDQPSTVEPGIIL